MTEIPNGWRTKTLKDWGMDAQSGFASGAHNSENKGIIHLRPMNISRLGKLDFEIYKSVEDESPRRIVKGDILFNNTNSAELVGKTTLIDIDGEFAYSNHMTRLRFPVEEVAHKYMSILLHSLWMSGYFNEICSNHVNQASVSIKRLEQVEVSLPPLPEQHKIVEILEDHLSRLDAALADVKQAKVKAAQFRRSLLQAAFTGNLGSDGTRHLTSETEVWPQSELHNLVEVLDKERIPVNSSERSKRIGEIPYYGATGQVGTIDKAIFDEELLILGEDGVQFFDPYKPKAYRISGPSWVNNHAHVLRPIRDKVNFHFLLHYLNHFNYAGFANGTTRLKLTQGAMNQIPVPIPPLPEQHKIVEILEDHLSRLDASIALADAMEKQSAGLRRSLLQAAFTGQLTKEVASV
jgi:type I restriction enzyme S subunit